jgi:hypothetical protein
VTSNFEPTIVDAKTVPALAEDFFKLAAEAVYVSKQRAELEARYKELSKRIDLYLRAVEAPKSIAAEGYRFTQTAGKAPSKKVDIEALRMELEKQLMSELPNLPVTIFVESWNAALAAATTEGKPGEPGLTIAALKEKEEACLPGQS